MILQHETSQNTTPPCRCQNTA